MHFDLWPAPMRAGLCTRCGGSRLPIRGGVVPLHRIFGRQRPLPACEMKATRRARPGGVRRDIIATSMDVMEPFARFASSSRLGDYAA